MSRFLYDTSVFVYALGGKHLYREPCRRVLELAAEGELVGEASADLVQELVHQRLRQTGDRRAAARGGREIAALCHLHPVGREEVLLGLELFEQHPRLTARDAVFTAVALRAGIDKILSTDRDFDGIPGLLRVDPADAHGVRSLQ